MPSKFATALVVAVTLMLVTSPGVAGAAFGDATSPDMHEASVEAADEIWVFENGDAVLVYHGTSEAATASGHAAIDVANGLAAIFLTDAIDPEVSGQGTVVLTPDMLDATGAVAVPAPESLTDLTVDLSTTTDETESTGSLAIDATFAADPAMTGDLPVQSTEEILATEGIVTVGSSLAMQGYVFVGEVGEPASEAENADAPAEPDVTDVERELYELSLVETDDGFVLTGYQSMQVSEFATDSWKTSEAAEETLLMTVGSVAEMLEGEATVTVDEHVFDEETGQLTMAYTVLFTDVEPALSNMLADAMADSQDVELTDEEREIIAGHIAAATLSDLSVAYEKTEQSTVFVWNVQLDGIDELMTANIELMALAGQDEATIDTATSKLAAKQTADLSTTLTWRGLVSAAEADTLTNRLQLEAAMATENWDAFVTELDARDIDVGTSTVDIAAGIEDGVLSTDIAVTVSQKDLVDMAVAQLTQQKLADEMDPKSAKLVDALKQGDFEKAKLTANMQEGTITVEAAAKFADLSKLGALLDEEFQGLHVQALYSELDAGETTTYVKVVGATTADPTIDDVQLLPEVGVDTVVHMPGEWDPMTTTFPEMDVIETTAFLEEETADDPAPAGDDDLPVAGEEQPEPIAAGVSGSTVGLALVALLGAALLARRYRF
ncbi:hypothetical protein [Haloarchaeobius amylolyticus]|uniref:hypothetical protein n=1 Tax=Haloarchaeobius amylolyticus TaxID=1198296 RepID=UPI002271D902|nr:hypothetical protein [Haloarchaeobius amylolyticus]